MLVDLVEDGVEGARLALHVLGRAGLDQLGPEPPSLQLAGLVELRPLVVEDRGRDLLDLEHAAVRAPLDGVDHDRRQLLEGQVVAPKLQLGHDRGVGVGHQRRPAGRDQVRVDGDVVTAEQAEERLLVLGHHEEVERGGHRARDSTPPGPPAPRTPGRCGWRG